MLIHAIDSDGFPAQCHGSVTLETAMTTTHYIAETDDVRKIAALWVKPAGRKSARVFNPSIDLFDPNAAATFDGATEAEIKRWIAVQKAITAR